MDISTNISKNNNISFIVLKFPFVVVVDVVDSDWSYVRFGLHIPLYGNVTYVFNQSIK